MAVSPSLWLPRNFQSHVVVAKEDIGQERLVLWRSMGCSWQIEGLSPNAMTSKEKLKAFNKTNRRLYPLRTPAKTIKPAKKITLLKNLNEARIQERRANDHVDEAKEVVNAIELLSDMFEARALI